VACALRDMPRQQQALGIIDHKEQQQRDEYPDGVELSLRDQDLKADAAAAGNEFANDRF
jgi:hypothetical protein